MIIIQDGDATLVADRREEGTIKDNVVSFKIVREFNGNKFTMKYSGTLSGDTIKGKTSFDRDGQAQERDWEAKRQK